ncbi:putative endonuclease [Gracilibacillus ureilyticus]|uniref:Putative endonuclease n=1 Tax=Gracilibacillus ureilyticus TaxID=531814 RepID=A0A1H9VNM6_9BACI|nr:GIY-YIG nuclease family protein [Gracilibacillus ureilyticus]SES23168.1 putative endonuclease [Gracilibacillus ureilyticus]
MAKSNNHFVYILECMDRTLYTGYTTNISRRLKMHSEGKGAKYTRGRGPLKLVYQSKCETKSEALQLEAKIKKLSKQEKIQLIHENARERCGTNENPKELSGSS